MPSLKEDFFEIYDELPWQLKVAMFFPGYNVLCWTLGGVVWLLKGAHREHMLIIPLAPIIPISTCFVLFYDP